MWLMIPAGCLGVLLVCGGGLTALIVGGMSLYKNSEPYQQAVQLAKNSPQVQQALGENIMPGWSIQGSIHIENNNGQVDMTIPMSGSRGNGQIRIRGTKSGSDWDYDLIEFEDEQGNIIDLNQNSDHEPSDAARGDWRDEDS
ncbi:MAG: hypothetical protein KF752_10820 [Pirellulaceae bacterium]|nr:hypothetical protein [Pirellulaceae bacterium]